MKVLVKVFIFVGLPKSVQSDQGSDFMSGVFQQVMHKLEINIGHQHIMPKVEVPLKDFIKP